MTDEPGAGRWSCSGNTSAGACSSYSGSTRPCVSRASPAAWQVPGERGPAVRERGRKRLASMQISYREGPGPVAAPSSPPDIRVQCQRPTGCAGDRGPKIRELLPRSSASRLGRGAAGSAQSCTGRAGAQRRTGGSGAAGPGMPGVPGPPAGPTPARRSPPRGPAPPPALPDVWRWQPSRFRIPDPSPQPGAAI